MWRRTGIVLGAHESWVVVLKPRGCLETGTWLDNKLPDSKLTSQKKIANMNLKSTEVLPFNKIF